MYRKIALSLCFTLFLGLLTACSPDTFLHLKKSESVHKKSSENTASEVGRRDDNGIQPPVSIPPTYGNISSQQPGHPQNETMPNGLPALKPMKGINVDTLFAEKIKDSDERFDRVENAVVDLRKEFEVYKPAIVRLSAVETDIQNLIKELEVLLQETPAQQPPLDLSDRSDATLDVKQLEPQPKAPPDLAPTPKVGEPAQTKKRPDYKKPPDKPSQKARYFEGIAALNFRIGEHIDKVRVAFDTNKKTPFSIDLDNDEKLIIVELPEARWEDKRSISYPNSKIIESLNVEPMGNQGSMIVLTLRKNTKILAEHHLSPDKGSGYHRIYFDLKP